MPRGKAGQDQAQLNGEEHLLPPSQGRACLSGKGSKETAPKARYWVDEWGLAWGLGHHVPSGLGRDNGQNPLGPTWLDCGQSRAQDGSGGVGGGNYWNTVGWAIGLFLPSRTGRPKIPVAPFAHVEQPYRLSLHVIAICFCNRGHM